MKKPVFNEYRIQSLKCKRIVSKKVKDDLKKLNGKDYIIAFDKAEKVDYTSYAIIFRGLNIICINDDCTDYDAKEQINLASEYLQYKGKKEFENLNKDIKEHLDHFINNMRKECY